MQASLHLCPTSAWGSSSCGRGVGGCPWWVQAPARAPWHSAKLSPFRVFVARSGPCSCWDGPPRHPLHHPLSCVPAGSAAGMGTLEAWRGLGARPGREAGPSGAPSAVCEGPGPDSGWGPAPRRGIGSGGRDASPPLHAVPCWRGPSAVGCFYPGPRSLPCRLDTCGPLALLEPQHGYRRAQKPARRWPPWPAS